MKLPVEDLTQLSSIYTRRRRGRGTGYLGMLYIDLDQIPDSRHQMAVPRVNHSSTRVSSSVNTCVTPREYY